MYLKLRRASPELVKIQGKLLQDGRSCMRALRFFLKTANSFVTVAVAVFLILAGVYSGYALWDNAQVYAAVDVYRQSY